MTNTGVAESTVPEAVLATRLNLMADALVAGRPDDVAEVYAENGVIVGFPGPNMPFAPVVGRTDIARLWHGVRATRWTLDVLSVRVQGAQAVVHGRSILEVAGQRFDSAFVCLWRQSSSDTWHIYADIFEPWTA